VGRTQQQQTLTAGHYMSDPSTIAKGLVNSKLLNLDLTWESTTVLDIGLELGFLNNRLTTEFDYYDRLTTGMLLPTSLSILLGGAYSAPQQNIGNLRNRGVELTLGWRDMISDKISYSVRANGSYNATYIEQWSGYLGRGATPNGNYTFLNMPYNYVYSYVDNGIAQTWQDVYNATPQGASPGDILREDLNGDGRIDENDRKAYPSSSRDRPNFNYGITASVSYKGLISKFCYKVPPDEKISGLMFTTALTLVLLVMPSRQSTGIIHGPLTIAMELGRAWVETEITQQTELTQRRRHSGWTIWPICALRMSNSDIEYLQIFSTG